MRKTSSLNMRNVPTMTGKNLLEFRQKYQVRALKLYAKFGKNSHDTESTDFILLSLNNYNGIR